ncbi:MAG: hypothetical protein KF885_05540 [Anaerolineales bacterium]|nr:hypothetical protein [Anaerolineales bacterium]
MDLFWPTLFSKYGFEKSTPPVFLTLETTEYFMAQVARLYIAEGFFETVTINQNRIYSQIIDNLNKAALNGREHTQILERLTYAAGDDSHQVRIFEQVQTVASKFRQYCLQNNLIDFSLQMEIISNEWRDQKSKIREYVLSAYRHLIYENSEEDAYIVHEFVKDLLPRLEESLILYDTDGGIRKFLGASPSSAYALKSLCAEKRLFKDNSTSQGLASLAESIDGILTTGRRFKSSHPTPSKENVEVIDNRFFPEMVSATVEIVEDLIVKQQVPPHEIVVLAPFLSDALRYLVSSGFDRKGIPWVSSRPSRSMQDEPVGRSLLALICIAHPDWGQKPTKDEVVHMLSLFISDLDIVRAHLLVGNIYKIGMNSEWLLPFDSIPDVTKDRIGEKAGNEYEKLRQYIQRYLGNPHLKLDVFLSQLFLSLLSQPGYRFTSNLESGRIVGDFISSAQRFRLALERVGFDHSQISLEFIKTLKDEIVQGQSPQSWEEQNNSAVFLAPAHTFLMHDRPVAYQFLLDIGNTAWHTRIYQPLTHPYVFNQDWPAEKHWSDQDEYRENREHLRRIMLGLVRRATQKVYLMNSQLSETGHENQGLLWETINVALAGQRS